MPNVLLPFSAPAIRVYLDYSFIFGVRPVSRGYDNFIYSNYSNLYFINSFFEEVYDPFDFFPAPRLPQAALAGIIDAHGHELWREVRRNPRSVIAFLEAQLQEHRYCLVTLDEYYLPGKDNYRRKHFIHHHLVVGIDTTQAKVAISGYLMAPGTDYGINWVSFSQFSLAFAFDSESLAAKSGQEVFAMSSYAFAKSFKVNDDCHWDLPVEMVMRDVANYLNSTYSPAQLRYHNKDISTFSITFGLSIYEKLREHLDLMQRRSLWFSIHQLRLLSEHKSFMVAKARHSAALGFHPPDRQLLADLNRIAGLARDARLILFSVARSNDFSAFAAVRTKLDQMRQQEEQCYSRWHTLLKAG